MLGDVEHSSIEMVRGDHYRKIYSAAISGILGKDTPPVYSKGSSFFNRDRWTLRYFIDALCTWAGKNPGCTPVFKDIRTWVDQANAQSVPKREIVIANTPDSLPLRTALALVGGAYHEAGHTWKSCRRDLITHELFPIVVSRWAKVSDWSCYTEALLRWSNEVEDIWIERNLIATYEGVYVKLCDLQDFILTEEFELWAKKKPEASDIVAATFRDLGLSYPTQLQKYALEAYKEWNKAAYQLVVQGPLTEFLKQALSRKPSEDLACLPIAMDIIATLGHLAKKDRELDQAAKGKPGVCPECGASPDKLKVRPLADGKGGKVKGKGTITCTVCGWQEEISIQPKNPKDTDPAEEVPEFEGFDLSGFAGEPSIKTTRGASEKKEGANDSNGNHSQDSKDSAYLEAHPENSQNNGGDQNNESAGSKKDREDIPESVGGTENSIRAGGHQYDPNPVRGTDLVNEAVKILDQGSRLKNLETILEEAVAKHLNKENKLESFGEQAWNPYDQSLDQILVVPPSALGKEHDRAVAKKLLEDIKTNCAYLRARLRSVVRSLEQVGIRRGVPKGKALSARHLTDTKACLISGVKPTKAFEEVGAKMDTSMAVAVVMDESSSMSHRGYLIEATKIFISLVEPIDGLGYPTLALGVRNGKVSFDREIGGNYHRKNGVIWDIFKGWDEKFSQVFWRFSNTRAIGSTPLSDGIQFALMALSQRNEAHRFLFVVSDGEPDAEHIPVIKRQLRIAKEAGINIIGVGMGPASQELKTLFPDHVHSDKASELPSLLLKKMNEKIDLMAPHRYKRVKNEI
jgi:hypothetical protein